MLFSILYSVVFMLIPVDPDNSGYLTQHGHPLHDHQRIVEMALQNGICDHNQLRDTVSRPFLNDLRDADVVVSENSRNVCKSARFIRNLKTQEIS